MSTWAIDHTGHFHGDLPVCCSNLADKMLSSGRLTFPGNWALFTTALACNIFHQPRVLMDVHWAVSEEVEG